MSEPGGGHGTEAVRDLIDLHEGRLGVDVLDDAGIAAILSGHPRIAMIGASPDPARPSNGVLRHLLASGYDVVPVNPREPEIEGRTAYPTLAAAVAATGPFDIVDVFRRPEQCAEHAREAVEAGARCLWLQLGIASREAGAIARAGGLDVVMDRCTSIEIRRIGRG
jgi:predicted CoA-binding protein